MVSLKRLLYFAIILTFSSAAFSETVLEEEVDTEEVITMDNRGCGSIYQPLRVAGMIGNPPFGWVERHDEKETKDLESFGLGRMVLDKLCEKLEISYVSTGFLSYNKAVTALKKGEIDLLLTAYYRPQDLGDGTSILYPGYFKNVFSVFFKKGKEFPVNSIEDLEGYNGIVRKEERIYPLIHQRLSRGMNLTQVSTAKKAFEMLMNGQADYLISSPYAAEAELRRYKLNTEIVSSPRALLDSNLFFVFTTNSNCWVLKEKFSDALRSNEFSEAKMEMLARDIIDDWGERFRDMPGLLDAEDETEENKKDEDDKSSKEEIKPEEDILNIKEDAEQQTNEDNEEDKNPEESEKDINNNPEESDSEESN